MHAKNLTQQAAHLNPTKPKDDPNLAIMPHKPHKDKYKTSEIATVSEKLKADQIEAKGRVDLMRNPFSEIQSSQSERKKKKSNSF